MSKNVVLLLGLSVILFAAVVCTFTPYSVRADSYAPHYGNIRVAEPAPKDFDTKNAITVNATHQGGNLWHICETKFTLDIEDHDIVTSGAAISPTMTPEIYLIYKSSTTTQIYLVNSGIPYILNL